MKQLFKKIEKFRSLEWKLRRVYENVRIEYKIYISRNSFMNFADLEILGREWEIRKQGRNEGQQQSRNYNYSYEIQNNFRRGFQNSQSRVQFLPLYKWKYKIFL